MYKLNTGLALREHFESNYNAYRRFLVANNYLSFKEVLKSLKESLCIETGRGEKNVIMKLAVLYEKKYCEEYKILYLDPDAISLDERIRNCPDCAAQCYHSHYFQLPWITHCQLHKKPLVYICPECQKEWPRISELEKTNCQTCGIRLSRKRLKDLDAFKQNRFISTPLFEFYSLIFHYKHYYTPILTSETRIAEYYYKYSPSYFGLPYMPAIIMHLNDSNFKDLQYYSIINANNIIIYPYFLEKTKIKQIHENINREEFSKIIKNKVVKKISTAALHYGINIATTPDKYVYIDQFVLDSDEGLVQASYQIWLSIVNYELDDIHRINKLVGNRFFQTPFYKKMPRTPRLPEKIFYRLILHHEINDSFNAEPYYVLPDDLRAHLYEIDLWRTFLIVFSYLKAIRKAKLLDLSWIDFYSMLPQPTHPDYWESYRYILYRTKSNLIQVIVPDFLNETVIEL